MNRAARRVWDALAMRGLTIRETATGGVARCPAHDDEHASLSMTEGDEGRALVRCHAGCSAESIVSALGLAWSDLFENGCGTNKRIVAEYSYHHADGTVAFQVVRFEPKDFRQRRPDGCGGWAWNLKGVRPVLYGLPELIATPADVTVFVVEGERDVDRLRSLGLIATTNPGGAGKWRAEYAEALRGRDVVVIPDLDAPGEKHARAVADSLVGLARSVKVLGLAGLTKRGADVSDWLDAGHTADDLRRLVAQAAAYAPSEETTNDPARPRIYAGDDDLSRVRREVSNAIVRANDPPTVFRHGAVLSRVEHDEDGVRIRPLGVDGVRNALADAACWFRTTKDGATKDARPPVDLAKAVLADEPDPRIPRLVRLVTFPILSASGEVVATSGYHAASGVFLRMPDGFTLRRVSENPTEAEIDEARDYILRELFHDFPFVRGADLANAFALFLLPFLRDAVSGPTPLHLAEKTRSGTGGSLLVDCVALASTGHRPLTLTEGRNEDEWRKRLLSVLLRAPSFVTIDNVKEPLESGSLSSVLTADTFSDRLLMASRIVDVPVRCAWSASGNNPSLGSEIARRTVSIRLDAKVEEPWARDPSKFRHPNLPRFVQENRGRFAWCGLTLGRAWIAAGRKPWSGRTLGSYERWCEVLGGALELAGVTGFLANAPELWSRADVEGRAWRSFIAAWYAARGTASCGVAELYRLATESDVPFDLGTGGERSQKTTLGMLLATKRDAVFSIHDEQGKPIGLVRVSDAGTFRRAQRWRLRPENEADGDGDNLPVGV